MNIYKVLTVLFGGASLMLLKKLYETKATLEVVGTLHDIELAALKGMVNEKIKEKEKEKEKEN